MSPRLRAFLASHRRALPVPAVLLAAAIPAVSGMVTPGTYYWQAYRIEYHHHADGCIETSVQKLVITG